jgi:flavin reductase (DIM6/NTAB) family NADH-FMN oxidoreductase RutF
VVEARIYRSVISRLATGVTALTTPGAGRHEVMTANAVVSVSLDPVLLLVSVRADCRWRLAARAAGRFAVNILSEEQQELSRWCASARRHDEPDRVLEHPSTVSERGLLVFDEALASLECAVYAEYPAGDHDLILGEILDLRVCEEREPLLFFGSGYRSLEQVPELSAAAG